MAASSITIEKHQAGLCSCEKCNTAAILKARKKAMTAEKCIIVMALARKSSSRRNNHVVIRRACGIGGAKGSGNTHAASSIILPGKICRKASKSRSLRAASPWAAWYVLKERNDASYGAPMRSKNVSKAYWPYVIRGAMAKKQQRTCRGRFFRLSSTNP